MPRKSLRPHLNQIRAWVRQGRTDAWVAHQLEVSVRDIEQFKRQNELESDEEAPETTTGEYPEEIDLRAEDDALIAAELEAAEAEAAEAEAAEAAEAERARAEADEDGDESEEAGATRTKRRSRRGGRGRRSSARNTGPLEGTFDHGDEGYGLWLDPAIQENPVYAEHWAGHRPVEVEVEEDRIVIRRVGDSE
jgi:septal ring factor EnvC (AmiA/AmiB activator)